jgi:hypothetical protein
MFGWFGASHGNNGEVTLLPDVMNKMSSTTNKRLRLLP